MINYEEEYLAHHGIKGQRRGIRRFQNYDGSLTAAGKLRYSVGNGGRSISKKVDPKYAAKLKKQQSKEAAKLERLKIKEAAKNEKHKEKLEKKKSHMTNKELWLKNHPEKKTFSMYVTDDVLKPVFEKAMKETVNGYASEFINYSTKMVVDSILNSPDFNTKGKKK